VNWKIVAAVLTVLWLALMIAASYYGYLNRNPVRIENWQPESRSGPSGKEDHERNS